MCVGFEEHHALGLDISKVLDAKGLGEPQHKGSGETYAQVLVGGGQDTLLSHT